MAEKTVTLTDRQLRFGLIKLALSFVGLFAIAAIIVTAIAGTKFGLNLAVNLMLFTVAFNLLANGVLAVLKITDWIEARRHG
uniref:hypothetical protein n=1 Tax=Altererythrobacter segetis TaxID=1104773 RepID=UPI001407FF26|nr:hypothetical protein [Altererythrobacter segetis]